jgi:hypothetical protein
VVSFDPAEVNGGLLQACDGDFDRRLAVDSVTAAGVHVRRRDPVSPVTRLLALVLYGLLLFMQQEGTRHSIDHLRTELEQAHQRSVGLPALTPCDECALLAAGANALTGAPEAFPVPVWQAPPPATTADAVPADRPRYYSARAPPLAS